MGEHLLLEVIGWSEVVGERRPSVYRIYLLLAMMLGHRAEVVGLRRLHSDYDVLCLLVSHYHPEVIAEESFGVELFGNLESLVKWKTRARVTPRAEEALTPDNFYN